MLATAVCVFTANFAANAQKSSKKQSDECQKSQTKLVAENESLLTDKKQLTLALQESQDLLKIELVNNRNFANFVKRVNTENQAVRAEFEQKNDKIKQLSENLVQSEDKIAKMFYEIDLLKDTKVTQIYDGAIDVVKAKFIEQMGLNSANFQFDESEENNFTISKTIDGSSEAWFESDKAMNVLLEMKAKFEVHKFDKNRTILYVTTNLSDKSRFSNKQFLPNTNEQKIKTYNTKMIQLLAADLKGSK